MSGGRWERLDVRGLGAPVALGDEVIAISGGGDDRVKAFAWDVAAARARQVAPSPLPWRAFFTAIGSDREVLVWGGSSGLAGPPGATYDPRRDTWSTIRQSPLPVPANHTAVWSGEEMLIWGGETEGVCSGPVHASPVAYDPAGQSWRPLRGAPAGGRVDHVAVWTGDQMLVWGGTSRRTGNCEPTDHRSDGATFDLTRNEWSRIREAPIAWLEDSDAVWTGHEMLVWNGGAVALYEPRGHSWRVASPAPLEGTEVVAGAPRLARIDEAFAWTGKELIIWGGRSARESVHEPYTDGAAYDPATDEWSVLPAAPKGITWPQRAIWHRGWLYVVAGRGWVRYRPAS